MPQRAIAALECRGVSLRRDGKLILDAIDWTVMPDEQWVVLGMNGSGKTSLVRIAALDIHPTAGSVALHGERLGTADVRDLRGRVGFVSAALQDAVRSDIRCLELVMSALRGAREIWWHDYTPDDAAVADAALERFGVAALRDAPLSRASAGERQRVFLARALVADPNLLIFDEPTAGLDLAGREAFVAQLESLTATDPPAVLVTHHLDEIPAAASHVLLLRDGTTTAQGPIDATLTNETLSECFDMPLSIERRSGRWSAYRSR